MNPPTSSAGATQDTAWHGMSAEEALARVGSTPRGLQAQEAARRLAADGPNELIEGQRIRPLQMFLGQFKSLIIWILIVAGAVSAALGQGVDATAIFTIVLLNAAIGFYQEFSAEKSLAALKQMTAPQAKVLRDGTITSIPAANLVAGDFLSLAAGDIIAADARLLKVASLTCNEATLTGESETVTKHSSILKGDDIPLGERKNMVFMGTSIAAGTGQAVVVATAMHTELGRIASLLDEAGEEDKTPLQRKLDSFGQILVWAALGIVALLFGLGLLRGVKLLDLFMTSVGLAVAAVPEGLPAVVTVALSLGVLRMSHRRALVRKLAAVETLGSTGVICTDKTGTLTVGEMTVRTLYVAGRSYEVTGEGYAPHGEVRFEGQLAAAPHHVPLGELATALLACNHAHLIETDGDWTTIGDPTEGAMLAAGTKAGANREHIERQLPQLREFPFDSERKRSSVIRRMPDETLRAFIHGAPDVLLRLCSHLVTSDGVRPMTDEDRRQIGAQNSAMATQALRVIGSARRDFVNIPPEDLTMETVENGLVFIGLSGMHDPPRPEVREAIQKCRNAGIRVVMITGDHPETAQAIAAEIGITTSGEAAIAGVELDQLPDDALAQRARSTAVYARVTAEHKLRIIRALKSDGSVVAMTGDGVNDAPAIKGADIGIAMGIAGTEVTKQAADMIITDDNFATIVAAVEEGRGIYENIRKTLQYLLAGNTGELLLMTLCVFIGLPIPLLPIHLLWINLITDGLPALCLATDPIDQDVMKRQPRAPSERLTNPRFLRTMVFTGVLTAGVAFGVYCHVLKTGTTEAARTSAFTVLVFAELLRAFGARSESKALWRIPFFKNSNLVIVVALSFGLQIWSLHNETLGRFLKTSSLSFAESIQLVLLGAIPLMVLELAKVVRNARLKSGTAPPSRATVAGP